MSGQSELLKTSDAARRFGVARSTLTRWIRLGQLEAVKLPSGQWRVRREDVEKLLRRQPDAEDD